MPLPVPRLAYVGSRGVRVGSRRRRLPEGALRKAARALLQQGPLRLLLLARLLALPQGCVPPAAGAPPRRPLLRGILGAGRAAEGAAVFPITPPVVGSWSRGSCLQHHVSYSAGSRPRRGPAPGATPNANSGAQKARASAATSIAGEGAAAAGGGGGRRTGSVPHPGRDCPAFFMQLSRFARACLLIATRPATTSAGLSAPLPAAPFAPRAVPAAGKKLSAFIQPPSRAFNSAGTAAAAGSRSSFTSAAAAMASLPAPAKAVLDYWLSPSWSTDAWETIPAMGKARRNFLACGLSPYIMFVYTGLKRSHPSIPLAGVVGRREGAGRRDRRQVPRGSGARGHGRAGRLGGGRPARCDDESSTALKLQRP